jgi:hypothetical protein
MMMQHDLRQGRSERAGWWLEQGIDVVPLKPHSKELQRGYGSRQAHISTTDLARQWFLNTDANLGVVLGGPSRLAVADWDSLQAYEAWRKCEGAMVETLVEQTARGYHVFFAGAHLPSGVGNGCEFKISGVCMTAPSMHPCGVIYRIVQNVPIASLTREVAYLLFPFLSEKAAQLARSPLKDESGHLELPKEKNDPAHSDSVVTRIKAARSIEDEIRASGVRLHSAGPNELVGLCPFDHGGSQDHRPSLWINLLRQRWGCYAPGCASNAGGEKAHDVINYRALWRGISNQEAIKQLADELLPPIA